MTIKIIQQLLPADSPNTSHNPLTPQGIVIHETADNGATAQNESDFEHTHDVHTSAHYFVDDTQIIQNIPENVVAWHAATPANDMYLSIELCHFDNDEKKFDAVWANGVALAADICHRHGFDPSKTIVSHAWVSEEWHNTDHTDPIGYFDQYKKTMDDFVNDVESALDELKSSAQPQGATVEPATKPKYTLPNGYISLNATGTAVSQLQTALNAAGAKPALDVDGDFGPATDKALKAFQKAQKLTVDGIYGPNTQSKLEAVLS